MSKKIYLTSLGCPKNLVDSERLANRLSEKGLALTTRRAEAEAVVINTCSFIGEAVEETLGEIGEACRWKNRGDINCLAVVGCLVARYGRSLAGDYPEVDLWLGVNCERELVGKLAGLLGPGNRELGARNKKGTQGPSSKVRGPYFRLTPRHYAYLKISEGCNNRCSYCSLPEIRGRLKSRSLSGLVREAEFLAAGGARELNLVAEDSTAWGEDIYGRPSLPRLLKALLDVRGLHWIRLLYCYPAKVDGKLIELLAGGKLLPYIDMPIQGASDKILKLMGRRYARRDILRLVEKLREKVAGICLRTTVIAGYPGERKREFESLVSFVKAVGFDRLGVFQYSAETGTAAASLPGQVAAEEKARRYHRLMREQMKVSRRVNRALKGRELVVLAEGGDWGRSYRDAPDVDGKVFVVRSGSGRREAGSGKGKGGMKVGEFYRVKIVDTGHYDLYGEISEEPKEERVRRR